MSTRPLYSNEPCITFYYINLINCIIYHKLFTYFSIYFLYIYVYIYISCCGLYVLVSVCFDSTFILQTNISN
jgi:hypothetical protein